MKHFELREICNYLLQYKRINSIKRVDDLTLRFDFEGKLLLYASLQRGNSHFFIAKEYKESREYGAPFDTLLKKYFTNSIIEKIFVLEGNRIVRFAIKHKSSYKSQKYILQLEFTGRNTNAIILDEKESVIEALRHIDKSVSFRQVRVGEILKPLPKIEFKEEVIKIENIEDFLYQAYKNETKLKLEIAKNAKLNSLETKKKRLENILNGLENEEELIKKSEELAQNGALILANLQNIKAYEKEIKLMDFENNLIKISMPKDARTPQEAANMLYKNSKRLKQKGKFLYLEKENLQSKIDFLIHLKNLIQNAQSLETLNILMPKQSGKRAKEEMSSNFESFYLRGHKIMVGKNERGNEELLKNAKKSDLWFHLKDLPSAHVLVRTDKQNLPDEVTLFAAKICANFSKIQKGSYLVDYTQRRNVRVVEGSFVNYVNYKTIKILKE